MKILDINKKKKEERKIKCMLPDIVIYYFSILTDHR